MINFSKIPNNNFFGKLLRFFLRIIPDSAIVRILQGRLKGKRWIKGSGINGYWLGNYEPEQVDIFEHEIKKGDAFFDIGANVGFYSLLASEIVGPSGKVFSFEPLPDNFKYLNNHIELNNIKNIFPFEVAVSDKNGSAFFGEAINRSQGKILESGGIKVKIVSLDEMVNSGRLPLPNVLKIDVEGAEVMVLKGAYSVLKKSHPLIFLSLHGEKEKCECFKILNECGYNLESIINHDSFKNGEVFIF